MKLAIQERREKTNALKCFGVSLNEEMTSIYRPYDLISKLNQMIFFGDLVVRDKREYLPLMLKVKKANHG